MQVDESRKGDETRAVDDIATGGTHGCDVDDEPIGNHEIDEKLLG